MSKSDASDMSTIYMMDDADTIAKKIKRATTDPEMLPTEAKGLEGRAEAENLVAIYAALADKSVADVLADHSTVDPGRSRDLETAIAGLPPGARHVLVLVGIYGHTHEEASQLLGIAVGTCKAQLHRVRALLSARLGETERNHDAG